ncbi:hypothetical protein ABZ914_03785 [Spirillospora sp. NPDC046719]
MTGLTPETSVARAVPAAGGPPRWTITLAITTPAGQTVTYTATTGTQPAVTWDRPSRRDPSAPAVALGAPTMLEVDRTFDLAGLPVDAAAQIPRAPAGRPAVNFRGYSALQLADHLLALPVIRHNSDVLVALDSAVLDFAQTHQDVEPVHRAFAAARITHRDALTRRTPRTGPEPATEWKAVLTAAAGLATALRPYGEARVAAE